MKSLKHFQNPVSGWLIAVSLTAAAVVAAQDAGPGETSAATAPASIGDASFRKAALLDSIYQAWMAPDSAGAHRYWFRKDFEIQDQVSSAHIWITCDDNYDLFINGTYIASDKRDSLDWMLVDDYDVGSYIKAGRNSLAVEAFDVDSTKQGLKVAVVYETIPDIEKQLDQMVAREVEAQQKRLEPSVESPVGEKTGSETASPTPEQIQELRTIEKNKLY